MSNIVLERVVYLPKDLAPGKMYYSEEYGVAGHLCACGCGTKVVTPINPSAWSLSERDGLPTLWPSVGNWQLACRSHYIITNGVIPWASQLCDTEIRAGRADEYRRRDEYFARLASERTLWGRFKKWVLQLWNWLS